MGKHISFEQIEKEQSLAIRRKAFGVEETIVGNVTDIKPEHEYPIPAVFIDTKPVEKRDIIDITLLEGI